MTHPNAKAAARASAQALEEVFHAGIDELTAPEVCDVYAAIKSITWNLPDLLNRLARQIETRAEIGELRDDRGPDIDPTTTATDAAVSLQIVATTWRTAGRTIEDAHTALAHLADHPTNRDNQ